MHPTETKQPALAVIGNPSSAASYAAGQDQAPDALRAAGLLDALSALGLPGTLPELRDAFGSAPLLTADRISFLGVDPAKATTWERRQADLNAFRYVTSAALHDDPVAAAETAVNRLPAAPLTVHIDVDVLDFTDAPLAEDTGGRNTGPTLDQLADAMEVAMRPRGTKPDGARILSIGELNPTRAAGTPDALPQFVRFLTRATSTPAPNPSQ